MVRPRTSAKLPRKGKRRHRRIFDRSKARAPGRSVEQIEYANLMKYAGLETARLICARLEAEVPDWRNGAWEKKLEIARQEYARLS